MKRKSLSQTKYFVENATVFEIVRYIVRLENMLLVGIQTAERNKADLERLWKGKPRLTNLKQEDAEE